MKICYRHQQPIAVLYARANGPYATSSKAAWRLMLDWLDERGIRDRAARGIGIICDNPASTGQFLRRYDACVELFPGADSDLAAGIGRQTLAGGSYAVHTHKGPHEAIGELFSRLHREHLPELGQTIDDTRSFIEVYLDDPARVAPQDLRTELWLPIQTQAATLILHSIVAAA